MVNVMCLTKVNAMILRCISGDHRVGLRPFDRGSHLLSNWLCEIPTFKNQSEPLGQYLSKATKSFTLHYGIKEDFHTALKDFATESEIEYLIHTIITNYGFKVIPKRHKEISELSAPPINLKEIACRELLSTYTRQHRNFNSKINSMVTACMNTMADLGYAVIDPGFTFDKVGRAFNIDDTGRVIALEFL